MTGQHYLTKLTKSVKTLVLLTTQSTKCNITKSGGTEQGMLKGYNKLSQELNFTTNSSDILQVISDVFPN